MFSKRISSPSLAACDVVHWGPSCANLCNCSVERVASCDPVDGCTVCLSGWTGGVDCPVNVDECAVLNGTCGDNAECTDTPGSYTCTCLEGFTSTTADGGNCIRKWFNTLRLRQNGHQFPDDILKCIFLKENT